MPGGCHLISALLIQASACVFSTWHAAQALLPVALQLHVLYQPSPLLPTASCRMHRHPWAMLMGSLLLAGEVAGGSESSQVPSGTHFFVLVVSSQMGQPPHLSVLWAPVSPRQHFALAQLHVGPSVCCSQRSCATVSMGSSAAWQAFHAHQTGRPGRSSSSPSWAVCLHSHCP